MHPDTEQYIKEIMDKTRFRGIAPVIFEKLWVMFSEIQCATWICPEDQATRDRFTLWLKTGNDNDAWT